MKNRINIAIKSIKITHVGEDEKGGKWYLVSAYDGKNKLLERRPISLARMRKGQIRDLANDLEFSYPIGRVPKETSAIMAELKVPKRSKVFTPVTQNGWSHNHLFMLGEDVLGNLNSDGLIKPILADEYSAGHAAVGIAGDYDEWKEQVAQRVRGNKLVMFTLMLAFAPPLCRFFNHPNTYGFQLVGESRTGKSTAAVIAGSVYGGGNGQRGFSSTWNETNNQLEMVAAAHNNLLLVLDETSLSDNGDDGQKWKQVVFRLASGSSKGRMTNRKQRSWQLFFLSTSEKTLSELIGDMEGVQSGVYKRLIDIWALEAKVSGKPSLFRGRDKTETSSLVRELHHAALTHYGHAGKYYIEALQELMRHKGTDFVSRLINKYQEEFRIGALSNKYTLNAPVDMIDSFAAVYAAGRMAVKLKVLDWSSQKDVMPASLFALRRALQVSDYGKRKLKKKILEFVKEQILQNSYSVWGKNMQTYQRSFAALVWIPHAKTYLIDSRSFEDITNCGPRNIQKCCRQLAQMGIRASHNQQRFGLDEKNYFVKIDGLKVTPKSIKNGLKSTKTNI